MEKLEFSILMQYCGTGDLSTIMLSGIIFFLLYTIVIIRTQVFGTAQLRLEVPQMIRTLWTQM
jgi:hypothetical protein